MKKILIFAVLLQFTATAKLFAGVETLNALNGGMEKAAEIDKALHSNYEDITQIISADLANRDAMTLMLYRRLQKIASVQEEAANSAFAIHLAELMLYTTARDSEQPEKIYKKMRTLNAVYFPHRIKFAARDIKVINKMMGYNSNDAAFIAEATALKKNIRKLEDLLSHTHTVISAEGILEAKD